MDANFNNTVVIVPIYNSEKYLEELFTQISSYFPAKQVIAINDASEDNSKKICEQSGVNFIDLNTNQGKGNALNVGFKKALEMGYSFAFTIDSDLQHKPVDFPKFIKEQNMGDYNLVIGRRDFSIQKMPLSRICSNSITSWILSFVTKTTILDSQSGFRLYDLQHINDVKFTTKRYQFETEVILKILKHNGKIGFVKIATIYDDQISYISKLRDIKNFVKVVIKEIMPSKIY